MASCSQVNSLFQAYIDGELGQAEKSILEHHLNECTACHEEMASHQACAARVFESLGEHRLVWGLRSRVLAHLPEMEPALKNGSHPTDPRYSRKRPRSHYPWALLGAAAILAICLPAFFYSGTGTSEPVVQPMGMVTFNDGKGVLRSPAGEADYGPVALKSLVASDERYETLADGRLALALIGGSTVKVNHNSALVVRDNRRVAVESGEVFFDIGRDRRHFYVDTPTGEILVFGTAFLVDVDAGATTLTVTEGDVLVRNGAGKAAVSGGNQLVFSRNAPMGEPYAVNTAPLVAWADAIVPDPEAMALFLQTLESPRTLNQSIPAHPIHVASVPDGLAIEAVVLSWEADGIDSGHCSYFVHVSDRRGNLILLDVLDSGHFNDQSQTQVEIPVPAAPIEGLDAVHVKLVPDYTHGVIEANISVEILAVQHRVQPSR